MRVNMLTTRLAGVRAIRPCLLYSHDETGTVCHIYFSLILKTNAPFPTVLSYHAILNKK